MADDVFMCEVERGAGGNASIMVKRAARIREFEARSAGALAARRSGVSFAADPTMPIACSTPRVDGIPNLAPPFVSKVRCAIATFLVIAGALSLRAVPRGETEPVELRRILPGEMVGLEGAFDGHEHHAQVVAEGNTEVSGAPAGAFGA